jgi:FkbM family methyltransferase
MNSRFNIERFLKLPKRLPELFRVILRIKNWGYVLSTYVGLRTFDADRKFLTRDNTALELATISDLVTAWLIFVRDEYTVPKNAVTILDIGANIGAFTVLAATANPRAKLVAVEPVPETYSLLQRNLASNCMQPRVTTLQCGVAAENGTRDLYLGIESPFSSLIRHPLNSSNQPPIKVNTITLTELIDRYFPAGIDMLKMDCEGAEHESILATPAAYLAKIKYLSLEYHPVQPSALLLEHLLAAGFCVLSDDRRRVNVGTMSLINRQFEASQSAGTPG